MSPYRLRGGGRWLLYIERDGRSECWAVGWTVGNREAADKRIWRVQYAAGLSNGKGTFGATFTLTKGAQVVSVPDNTGQTGYSGQDTNPAVGVFAVEGLDFGTWVLTETVVPQGYAGIAPRNVEVVASQTPILLGGRHGCVGGSGEHRIRHPRGEQQVVAVPVRVDLCAPRRGLRLA